MGVIERLALIIKQPATPIGEPTNLLLQPVEANSTATNTNNSNLPREFTFAKRTPNGEDISKSQVIERDPIVALRVARAVDSLHLSRAPQPDLDH